LQPGLPDLSTEVGVTIMATDLARTIAEAYRWQRRLGNRQIAATHCHIVSDQAHPDLWDSNHADDVTAQTETEIDSVFADMDEHLGHTRWRVIHTNCFTPDAFLARLALDNFAERPVTIQMALRSELTERGAAIELRPVAGDADWDALFQLVLADNAEGRRTGDLDLPPEFSAAQVAGYRAKSGAYHFYLGDDRCLHRPPARRRLSRDLSWCARHRATLAPLCAPGFPPGDACPHLGTRMADLNGIALDARFYFAASAAHQFQSLSGKSANQCPALLRKIFRFTFHPNHLYIYRHPGPHEGRIAIVTDVGHGTRWTQGAPKTRALTLRTAKPCGPDAPTLASSW
jgi:hypothetical protein